MTTVTLSEILQSLGRNFDEVKIRLKLILKAGGFTSGFFYYEKSEINNWILKYRIKTKEELKEITSEYVMKHRTKY